MSKFNLKWKNRTGISVVKTRSTPTGLTFEGAPGYGRDAKSELFLLAVTALVGEDTFYESGQTRDLRLAELVREVAVEDLEWIQGLIGWVRRDANLRSAAIVLAAQAVRARLSAGIAGGNRALVSTALARADEPAEFLAYWISQFGRNLPQPVKRGVADAAVRLYNERSLIKYDSSARDFRFADVIELTHPVPSDGDQSALFRYALDRRRGREVASQQLSVLAARAELLQIPVADRRDVLNEPQAIERLARAGFTWESLAGWLQGPLDAAAWQAAIPSMGYMALLRNLRNFDEAGVCDEVAVRVAARLADADEVAKSRQLPLRFLSAYRSTSSMRWDATLETALQLSLANVLTLPGRTLILVDRSGSMFYSSLSKHSGLTLADAAAVFGSALALRAEQADLVQFGNDSQAVRVRRGDSVLKLAARFGDLGGTQTEQAVRRHYRGQDRVIILTDEQAWPGYGKDPLACVPAKVPAYTFNPAGYRFGHGPSGAANRHTFGGLTDHAFAAIQLLEAGRDANWPWLN